MEHLVGYVIIGLSVLLTSVMILVRWLWWRRTWLDTDLYSTARVRFAYGAVHTPEIGDSINQALRALAHVATKYGFTDENEFWIEVVPPGEIRTPTVPSGVLPDGTTVGGSVKTVRFLPFTKKYWVAAVVNERTGAFIIHEVVQHIWAFKRFNSLNSKHNNPELGTIEQEAQTFFKNRS